MRKNANFFTADRYTRLRIDQARLILRTNLQNGWLRWSIVPVPKVFILIVCRPV